MRTELTSAGSIPYDAFSAYQIKPDDEPWLQRNFVLHQGSKRTHAISVGFPSGVNYSYDNVGEEPFCTSGKALSWTHQQCGTRGGICKAPCPWEA